MTLTQACQALVQSSDITSAIVGGLIGALAGGFPAWLLAKRQSQETLHRDREQRTEKDKALAFSTCVKLWSIINSVITLRSHIMSCMTLLEQDNHSYMEPWQVLTPMVGHTDEGSIRFSPDEMAVFAASSDYDFMQEMMLLSYSHASSLSAFDAYCKMRMDFRNIAPKMDDFSGAIGKSNITQNELNRLKPYTIPMNDIAVSLEKIVEKDFDAAKLVAERFGTVTKKIFKGTKFPSLSFPDNP